MIKILVTGSTGFLGKHFIQYLHKYYSNQFEIVESNTKQLNLLGPILSVNKNSYDYIFHFAAVTKAGDWCLKHPGEQWLTNQQINTNIIKFWKEYNPNAKFIAIGTSCSYGENRIEEEYLKGNPEESLLTYAYTKRMLYLGLDAMNKQYGMDYLYFVPSTLYGSQFTETDNHFIYDIIRKVYEGKYNETKVEMWGNGHQKRELVWVEDFIEIMLGMIFDNHYRNEIINVGSGQEYSMNYYYQKICDLFNYDYDKVEKDLNKYVGMDSNKLVTTFTKIKDFEFKPINDGLKELVKYYKAIKYD